MNKNTYSYKPLLKGKSKFLLSIQKQSKCVAANFTQLSICQSSHTSSFRIRISPFPHMLEYGENVSYTFLQLLHSYLFSFSRPYKVDIQNRRWSLFKVKYLDLISWLKKPSSKYSVYCSKEKGTVCAKPKLKLPQQSQLQ